MKIMEKTIAKTLSGFMELLPNEQVLFNQMKEKIQKTYEKFGFLPIDTPIIESTDVLLAKAGGETEKQIYSFTKGDNNLTLRFDLTVPLAKYVAINANELSFPFRRYQIGKVYRGERAQRGRFREFYQCDIDVIGDGELNIINDAEIPSIMYEVFKELGLDNFCIKINNRKILNGLFETINAKEKAVDIMRVIDKIEKIGVDKVKEELAELKISEENIEKVINFIKIDGSTDEKLQKIENLRISNETYLEGVKELKEVIKYIRLFNVPEEYFAVDASIARGLDYYTGTVYETFLNDYKSIGSICSGGRYNNLSEFYTDKKMPGVGMSIGLTRLFFILNDIGLIKADKKSISEILIISMIEDLTPAIETANKLRQAGINTEIYFDNKKIKTKFKYADKLKIPYVIVIGEDEIKTGTLTLRNMETGEQEKKNVEEIVSLMKYE
jgi:histidyl-tRNA synthetase